MKGKVSIAAILSLIGVVILFMTAYAGLAVSGLVSRLVAILIAVLGIGIAWLCLWFGLRSKRERAYMKNWSTVSVICSFFLLLDVALAIWPAMVGVNFFLGRKQIQESLDQDRIALVRLRDEAYLPNELNRADRYRTSMQTLITSRVEFTQSMTDHINSVYFSNPESQTVAHSDAPAQLTSEQLNIKFRRDTSAIVAVSYERASYRGSIDDGISRLENAVNNISVGDIVNQTNSLEGLMESTAMHFSRVSASRNIPEITPDGEVSSVSTATEYAVPESAFIATINKIRSFSWTGLLIAVAMALLSCFVYWITPPEGQGSIDYKKPKPSDAYGLPL